MPKVTEITVHAGRVVPHPFEQYSNLRPGLTVKAELSEGEDPVAAVKALQAQAEGLLEDHSRNMVTSLKELNELSIKQSRIASLQREIERAQRQLDSVWEGIPALTVEMPSLDRDDDEDDHRWSPNN